MRKRIAVLLLLLCLPFGGLVQEWTDCFEGCPDQNVILAQLPAGQEMRILAHTEEGWLHVLAPYGELDWTLNAAGIDGYVRMDEVESDLLAKGVPSADSF